MFGLRQSIKVVYHTSPALIKILMRWVYNLAGYIPFTFRNKQRRWVKSIYTKYNLTKRNEFFLSAAKYFTVNRPILGYYFEFGSFGGNTMKLAWQNFRYLFDFTYVSFDSFEGLPKIEEIDKQEIWEEGKLKVNEKSFRRQMRRVGIPSNKLVTIKGFYNVSLTEELKKELLPQKAAMIYIDCDLYHSTVPVLEFIIDFLQIGTIIVFDDWNCFHGNPGKGERKAFSEFKQRHPDFIFEDFIQTHEGKAFIYLGKKD